MLSLAIKNLRSLINVEPVEIRPITILLGENSAGKSTFLRTFPLFKQSLENKTSSTISWVGDYVDFGSFDVAHSCHNSNGIMQFTFSFDVPSNISFDNFYFRSSVESYKPSKNLLKVTLSLSIENDILSKFSLNVGDINLDIHFDDANSIKIITLNGLPQNIKLGTSYSQLSLIPEFFIFENGTSEVQNLMSILSLYGNILEKYTKLEKSPKKLDGDYFWLLTSPLLTKETFIKFFLDNKSYQNNLKNGYNDEKLYFDLIKMHIPNILNTFTRIFNTHFNNLEYVKPLRENGDRMYKVKSSKVRKLDSSGKNLPEFILSLDEAERLKFDMWTESNFSLKIKLQKDDYSIARIMISDGDRDYNIADMGHGYTQILPLLVLFWHIENQTKKKSDLVKGLPTPEAYITRLVPYIIAIEQPEVHLHPRFQAKLAQLIAQIIKRNKSLDPKVNFLIETHSETFINQLIKECQVYKTISFQDLNVIFFNKDNFQTITKTLDLSNDRINDWPIGFFMPEV